MAAHRLRLRRAKIPCRVAIQRRWIVSKCLRRGPAGPVRGDDPVLCGGQARYIPRMQLRPPARDSRFRRAAQCPAGEGDHENQRGEHRERGRRSCRLDGRGHGCLLRCIGARAGSGAAAHRRGSAGDASGAGLQHDRPAIVRAIRRRARQYRVLALFDRHRHVDGADGRTRRHRLRDDAGAVDAHGGGCDRHGECRSAVDPQTTTTTAPRRRPARRARRSTGEIARCGRAATWRTSADTACCSRAIAASAPARRRRPPSFSPPMR